MKLRSSLIMVWLVLLAGATVSLAQNTAFSYQGRLNRGTGAATGLYDFQFGLFTADSGGTQQGVTVAADAVPVTNGLFTVLLDFGASSFSGGSRWLDVMVRSNGTGGFSAMTVRHPLVSVPYAIRSLQVSDGAITSASLANGAVTAAKMAPGAVSQLGAPGGSPVNAVQVNPNGLVGVGTSAPAAGLDITTSAQGTNLIPKYLFEVANNTGSYTNLDGASSVASYGSIVAIGSSEYSGGLTLLNTATPTAPVLLFQARNGAGGIATSDGLDSLTMTSNLLAFHTIDVDTVTLVSISNPANPMVLSQLRNGVGVWTNLWAVAETCGFGGCLKMLEVFGE